MPGLTLDTGALVGVERRKRRVLGLLEVARREVARLERMSVMRLL